MLLHSFMKTRFVKESIEFIKQFKEAGIKTTLLTGDSLINAGNPSCVEIGITDIVANAKPEDKLACHPALETLVTSPMMVGDGINDAPIHLRDFVSVAMGGGTDVAKPQRIWCYWAINSIDYLNHVHWRLKRVKIIRENLAWSLGITYFILPLAVAGLVAPYIAVVGMSASSIIVV